MNLDGPQAEPKGTGTRMQRPRFFMFQWRRDCNRGDEFLQQFMVEHGEMPELNRELEDPVLRHGSVAWP
jgi:hypothetical protein